MAAGTWSTSTALQPAGIALVAAYVGVVHVVGLTEDYDAWAGLVVMPLLVLVNLHLILRVSRRQEDRWLRKVLMWGFVLKALGTVARYVMAFVVYEGVSDAAAYHAEGARLAESYRQGDFGEDIGSELVGTGFVRVATGALYSVTGPSIFVAYAFFATLSFWGLYFFVQAFRQAVPSGDVRRYALLVFFLPSMLFWPSALGKDAWMTFTIGLAMLGAGRLLSWRTGWLLPLTAGLVGTAVVRPPITAAILAGVAIAWVVRKRMRPGTAFTPIAGLAMVAALVIGGVVVVNQAAAFMQVESISSESVQQARDTTTVQTAQGGSEFDAQPVESPLDMPMATVSVLSRPFLFEANNIQTMIAALEGTLLLGLVALSLPRMRGILKRLRVEPYLLLCVVYVLLFVYGYSNMANFGILTRQRVQVLPFVLVFVALLPLQHRIHVERAKRPSQEMSS